MLFNSFVFLFLFLPATWLCFRFACAIRLPELALTTLMLASLLFYSYWNPPFVLLIIFSILFNYSWGRLIEKHATTCKFWLYSGVIVNLSLIAYFKYANFFMSNIAWLIGSEWAARDIFLPLGISFFTFQQMAYLIDCSKGLAKEHSFTHYALFVTFFPQLIAGPIVRYEEIVPQFSKLRTFAMNYKNIAMGIALLSLGLFKKVVIADTLSPWVAAAFDTKHILTFFEAWGGALSYAFQIYFDFSGYSDMALGLAKLFNIDLLINFNSPYKALSISDFWRRWHISLSSFLKDYLYIPLGGNRNSRFRRNFNLMTTMLLGGLWHGASWNFVVWGGLHGFFLMINHAYRNFTFKHALLSSARLNPFYWLCTFFCTIIAWVFFRATSFSRSLEILYSLIGGSGILIPQNWLPVPWLRDALTSLGVTVSHPSAWTLTGGRFQIAFLVFCSIMVLFLPNSYEWIASRFHKNRFSVIWAIGIGGLLTVSICFLNNVSEFLYFQF